MLFRSILRATDFGVQDVLTVDPSSGAVKYKPEMLPKPGVPIQFCPSPIGGKSWPSMSYSPELQALFIPYLATCAKMTFVDKGRKPGGGGGGGEAMTFTVHPKANGNPAVLSARDLNGQILWEHRQRAPFVSATLTTASGLVFVADNARNLFAFDAKTGKVAWQMDLPTTGHGFPASYGVGGRQFIALPLGTGTPLDSFTQQFVPEIPTMKPGNSLVVFALPQQ